MQRFFWRIFWRVMLLLFRADHAWSGVKLVRLAKS
jgi:hypothetical protein